MKVANDFVECLEWLEDEPDTTLFKKAEEKFRVYLFGKILKEYNEETFNIKMVDLKRAVKNVFNVDLTLEHVERLYVCGCFEFADEGEHILIGMRMTEYRGKHSIYNNCACSKEYLPFN